MAKMLNVDTLKREAKKLGTTEGIRHTTALNLLAYREGYKSWADLMREQNRFRKDDQDYDDTQPIGEHAHLSAYDQPTYLKTIFR